MFHRWLVVCACAALLEGCNGGGASPRPFDTGTLTPKHLYVASANSSQNAGVIQYTLPLTPTSVPNFSMPIQGAESVAVDANGDLAALDSFGSVRVYVPPVTPASVPVARFSDGPGPWTGQVAFTNAGDLFVPLSQPPVPSGINFFRHPFTNGSRPEFNVINASIMTITYGIGIDAAQNLYVANWEALPAPKDSQLMVYAPPYLTASPVVTPPVPGAVFMRIVVGATQLFVSNGRSGAPAVEVYTLPITATSVPAFEIKSGVATPIGVALDSAGNLYVANDTAEPYLTVYAPPFSAASAPVVTLPLPKFTIPQGLAVGP